MKENVAKVSELKKGDWFTLKEIETPNENQVYVRGAYDRASKSYCCYKFSDVNSERCFKGTKTVYIGFTF